MNSIPNKEIIEIEPFSLIKAINLFNQVSHSNLTFLEGLRDDCLDLLKINDPSESPADVAIFAIVKDGDYNNSEFARTFNIWNHMEKNYVKLYQSKNYMNNDGATWFFLVFKKRMLIQKDREVLEPENEQSPLFDESIFKNYY